jgi:hypothetical protein
VLFDVVRLPEGVVGAVLVVDGVAVVVRAAVVGERVLEVLALAARVLPAVVAVRGEPPPETIATSAITSARAAPTAPRYSRLRF